MGANPATQEIIVSTSHQPPAEHLDRWARDDGWARLDEFNDHMLAPFNAPLVAAINPRPGHDVLDAGCGTGRLALRLAAAVQPGGTVTGVDISPASIARARSLAAGLDLNIDLIVGDVSAVALPAASFDVVVSRFVAMLYHDPVLAHARLRSLLRPGGRYIATVWQALDRNEWHALPLRAVQRFVDLGPNTNGERPGPFAFADPARIERVLTSTGFVDITVTTIETTVSVGGDLDEALQFFQADARASLRAFTDDHTIDRIAASLRDDLAPHRSDRGVHLPAAAWLITAQAPPIGGAQ
jgi:SAM-dependent methyltransferase